MAQYKSTAKPSGQSSSYVLSLVRKSRMKTWSCPKKQAARTATILAQTCPNQYWSMAGAFYDTGL